MSNEELLEAIKGMTVLELSELVKSLEDEFGVSAAAPVAVAAAPAASAGDSAGASGADEKTDFTVTLKEVGPNKINVIKGVREVTTLGLKEAKEYVDKLADKSTYKHVLVSMCSNENKLALLLFISEFS